MSVDIGRIGFHIARIAHWSVNDPGYTKRHIAADLAYIARQLLPPEQYASAIGDAGVVAGETKEQKREAR